MEGSLVITPRTRAETVTAESAVRAAGPLKLDLRDVAIITASLANVPPRHVDAITARAVASLDRLLDMTRPFCHPGTVLVFPKGKSAAEEVETARRTWQGRFEIVPSRTDANAGIVVARDVRRRGK